MARTREVILQFWYVGVLCGELREPQEKTRFAREAHVCFWEVACDESRK